MTLAKVFSCEFYEVLKNNYFVEYLRTAASESVWYLVYTLLSEVHLEEKKRV